VRQSRGPLRHIQAQLGPECLAPPTAARALRGGTSAPTRPPRAADTRLHADEHRRRCRPSARATGAARRERPCLCCRQHGFAGCVLQRRGGGWRRVGGGEREGAAGARVWGRGSRVPVRSCRLVLRY
jgi:hypothetical protein